MPKLTARQIELWIPESIYEFAGCEDLKQDLADRIKTDDLGGNTILHGLSSTGKSAMIKAFIRAFRCQENDQNTLRPCGVCDSCKNFDVRYEQAGLFAIYDAGIRSPINYYPVNCADLTPQKLNTLLANASAVNDDRALIYFDEVHELAENNLDERLLIPLREIKAVVFASSTSLKGLKTPFRRRFPVKRETSLPDEGELAGFLADRCRDWEITFEQAALQRIAEKSRCIVGDALGVLGCAASRPSRHIDLKFAERHTFDFDDA